MTYLCLQYREEGEPNTQRKTAQERNPDNENNTVSLHDRSNVNNDDPKEISLSNGMLMPKPKVANAVSILSENGPILLTFNQMLSR